MRYQKPNLFCYRLAQVVSWFVATFLFGRKILRNELKGVKGPYVVIANHEAALDFVNLIGATRRPMSFVISKSFFSTLPIQGFLKKMGVIPKQQFQTSADDLKKMKRVIDAGMPVVIYPAGLMCEDGVSTPIPGATYKFLKWLGVDVYVARTQGTYFVMPKWSKRLRPGRTYIDIYKLLDKEELSRMDLAQIQKLTDEALLYDAYEEQEKLRVRYKNGDDIRGLENVLYLCPNCGREFTMEVLGKNVIRCSACGYQQTSDSYGFFRNSGIGPEIRNASGWNRWILGQLEEKICRGEESTISASTDIWMVDQKKHKFVPVGSGVVRLDRERFVLEGTIDGQPVCKEVRIGIVPALPFSPGKHLEIQDGGVIYRCVLSDGRPVIKFINMLKIFYRINQELRAEKNLKPVN